MDGLFDQGHLLGQEELEKLDKMVSDYLLFRSFKQTQQQLFLDKRSSLHGNGQTKEGGRHQRATIQRILNALDNGDYPQLVTLWDSFITQKIGTVKSSLLAAEAREAEFLANLCGAIYPLRPEIIQIAGDPALAAKVAARAMTIFKHYLETRGARLVEFKDLEFYPYRNLFKIAFPPAHPQFKHLFTDAWSRTARERIVKFMEKFFTPSDLPVLCTLYERLNTKAETELKEIFRRRERKLLKFSRSVYALANDLLTGLESGKPVDKAFLSSFRNRFNTFGEIIRPDNDFDEEMGSLGSPVDGQEISGLSISTSSPTNKKGVSSLSPNRHGPGSALSPARSKIVHKVADLGHLDYTSMARDIAFMSGDVGTELGGLVTRDYLLSLADAAVKSQVAMQGCVLLQALVEYISRPDKEIQTQSARTSAVTALCRVDILGLRSATTQHTFVDISSGSIGLESRSITRLLFSLAEAMKKIPEPSTPRGDLLMESAAKTPPYERLLVAGQVIAEYSCRLILALSTATPGVSYLHTFGVRLTAALADFLVSLPLQEDFDSSGDDELGIYGHPSSSSFPSMAKRGGGAIRTWCLMALSVLTGQSKTNQLVVLKRGGVSWLTRTLGMYISEVLQLMRNSPEPCDPSQYSNLSAASVTEASTGLFEMSFSLLNIIVYSAEARRFLVGSLNMQRETESLAGVLLLLIATCGRTEYQSNLIVSTLQILLREVSMRELLRTLNETTLLRNSVEQGVAMSVDAAVAKNLLAEIDSNSSSEDDGRGGGNDANPEVGDLLEMVSATQVKLSENPLLTEYCSGMTNSGLAFLMRYTSSAGRIFVGEEQQYQENDGRLHSPPIHANRFIDDLSPGALDAKDQPKLKPSLPRTPPRLDQGANPRYLSHGKEIVDGGEGEDEDQEEGSGHKKSKMTKAKSKKNQDDDEEEEEEDEEEEEEKEVEKDDDGEGDEGGDEDEEDD